MGNSAAIVGGGIGGLATAHHLLKHGWTVDVFERSGDLPRTGTALGMWPDALAALDVLGLGARVREIGRAQRRGEIRRSDGSVIADITSGRGTAVLISRPRLLETLAAELPGQTVKFHARVEEASELRGYDVVVGADGVHSRIRDSVTGQRVEPRSLGFSALIGFARGDTDVVAETWGEGKIFGITPRDGGVTNWFAAYREDADAPMPADPAAFLRRSFGHWHADVAQTLERIEEASLIKYQAKEMPRLPSYVRGNVAVIGDAAHAMAPNLGRGACEAIVDGVTLARALTAFGVPDGLRHYDQARRKHTQRLVAGSRLAGRLAMSTHHTGVRDAAVRVLSRLARASER